MARHMRKDLLLNGLDLPASDRLYFTEMSDREFNERYSNREIQFLEHSYRSVAVLRLQLENNNVIPIPFIVDTGSPGFLYFGLGARKRLNNLGILRQNRYNPNARHQQGNMEALTGTLLHADYSYRNPIVSELPKHWLENQEEIWNRPQANILGIQAMAHLPEILICISRLLAAYQEGTPRLAIQASPDSN